MCCSVLQSYVLQYVAVMCVAVICVAVICDAVLHQRFLLHSMSIKLQQYHPKGYLRKCYLPKPTISRNSNFPVQVQINPKF